MLKASLIRTESEISRQNERLDPEMAKLEGQDHYKESLTTELGSLNHKIFSDENKILTLEIQKENLIQQNEISKIDIEKLIKNKMSLTK